MRFLPPDEPVELYETGFDDDLLGREKVSKALSEVLERIEDPLVVALDGRWGTGKSYFLKRWVGAHRKQNSGKALTVYFDAFAHDYLTDPLIGLVSCLSERVPKDEQLKLERLKKVAIKFLKPAARLGLSLATYGATEAFNRVGDTVAEAAKGEAEKAIEEFWKREEGRQAAMEEFRAAIKTLTSPAGSEAPTPLIIVIDELDRCRTDYALEVLEVIKHFFAVPHVHFLLGANLNALENSVKARYGVEIDATAYLQKFLSFTLNLPDHVGDRERTPSIIRYANHLGAEMGTPKHLLGEICTQLGVLGRCNQISIRDVGKILSTVALLPDGPQEKEMPQGLRVVTITLIIIKLVRPDLFIKLLSDSIDYEDLISYIGATENYIRERLSDRSLNPNFDYNAWLIYTIWMFIRFDGASVDDDERPWVASQFGTFGRRHNFKELPRWVYENWLVIFNLHE